MGGTLELKNITKRNNVRRSAEVGTLKWSAKVGGSHQHGGTISMFICYKRDHLVAIAAGCKSEIIVVQESTKTMTLPGGMHVAITLVGVFDDKSAYNMLDNNVLSCLDSCLLWMKERWNLSRIHLVLSFEKIRMQLDVSKLNAISL